ncbi:MAG: 3-deoxy-manno-octulosonate cytidylyltransferase [Myxococcota bacterium]
MRTVRTAIVIPSRRAATRLPNKPLVDLGGLPLIARVERQARKCGSADIVVVATDDEEIAAAVAQHGGRAIMTRLDHVSGTDRVAEAAAGLDAELIVNVQGDEPFLDPRDVDTVIEALKGDDTDMATLSVPIADADELRDPNVVKLVIRDDGRALYFSRAPIPFSRDGKFNRAVAFRHLGVYGYRKEALEHMTHAPAHPLEMCEGLEQLRALALGMTIAVRPGRTTGRGIDTQEDLDWARARVSELGESAFP